MTRRLYLAGKAFSPNLGDGVISECLAHLLRKHSPDDIVIPFDIAPRTDWQPETTQRSSRLWSIARRHQRTRRFRNIAYWNSRRNYHHVEHWKRTMSNADSQSVLIIGGGQLLMDNELGFPYEISRLVDFACERGITRIHFAACGVGKHWSGRAQAMFTSALGKAHSISVRDPESAKYLNQHCPTIHAQVTTDPAICANEVYPGLSAFPVRNLFGINIMDSVHFTSRLEESAAVRNMTIDSFWIGVIERALETGLVPELFCNGDISDHRYACRISRLAQEALGANVNVATRPLRPEQLADLIRSYKGILSTRLHCSIIATSLSVPCVGISWDPKVLSFYNSIGRVSSCFRFGERELAIKAWSKLVDHVENPLDFAPVQKAIDQSHNGLHEIVSPTSEEL